MSSQTHAPTPTDPNANMHVQTHSKTLHTVLKYIQNSYSHTDLTNAARYVSFAGPREQLMTGVLMGGHGNVGRASPALSSAGPVHLQRCLSQIPALHVRDTRFPVQP